MINGLVQQSLFYRYIFRQYDWVAKEMNARNYTYTFSYDRCEPPLRNLTTRSLQSTKTQSYQVFFVYRVINSNYLPRCIRFQLGRNRERFNSVSVVSPIKTPQDTVNKTKTPGLIIRILGA